MTSVISSGSNRGVTDARVTPYAFWRTRTPNAAGSSVSVSLCWTAPAIPQHSRPRASMVPIRMYRRPCCTRSSIGPTKGASSANGAIVMISASATRPRAWVTDVLKNSVPARATATNPSPTLPAADNSISWARPVRPAPEAWVTLCSVRVAPPAAAAPARPVACDAETNDLAARLARAAALSGSPAPAPARESPMDPVLGLDRQIAAPWTRLAGPVWPSGRKARFLIFARKARLCARSNRDAAE